MKIKIFSLSFITVFLLMFSFSANAQISVKNTLFLKNISANINTEFPDSLSSKSVKVLLKHESKTIALEDSITLSQLKEYGIVFKDIGKHKIIISGINTPLSAIKEIRVLPGWVSLIPPFLAILLALLTRQVLVALFFGIFSGSFLIYNFNLFTALSRMLDTILVKAINEPERISIIIFSLVLGGMVGVISKSGGTYGIVEAVKKYATTRRRGLFSTFFLGIFIFFDDYANTLIVGNTMRPLTDKLKISREKLSYIIDSTAAPVANIAIISTWIGYELSILNQSFQSLNLDYNPYISFIKSISFNFYPIFTLIFIFMLIYSRKDYGPMFKAEVRAKEEGLFLNKDASPLSSFADQSMEPDKKIPKRWINAFIPILLVILMTLGGLIISGLANMPKEGFGEGINLIRKFSLIIGSSNSFHVLLWSSFLGSIAAIVMGFWQKLFSLHGAVEAWVGGIKAMVPAAIILTAAWSIGAICDQIHTAPYVVSLTKSFLSPNFLPAMTFLTAGVIAFATGTSWGTMAILLPIVIPLAYHLPLDSGYSEAQTYQLIITTFAAVLAGATFGDHCSPISDTTIMSSMASGADHIDHVRTQLPYALTVGIVSILIGYIPAGYFLPPIVLIPLGIIAFWLIIKYLGKTV